MFIAVASEGEDKKCAILVDDGQGVNLKWWIKDLELYESDFKVLNSGSELTENIINAAQKILLQQFPHMGGFQSTTHLHYLNFQQVSDAVTSVQILHTGRCLCCVYLIS